ncbi:MAG TPA: hypothetical protein EYN71_03375 [Flavobacteriales bacterium]|nr:hypothetical protein [Flavobacteriales bacterium]HIO67293.1 hypothetical protein [Flavobacteriales bacterium]
MAKRRRRKKRVSTIGCLITILLFGAMGVGVYFVKDSTTVRHYADKAEKYLRAYFKKGGRTTMSAFKLTESNYGSGVEKAAEKYGLPASYLKALIVLECSGKKPVQPRYERHVFKKLKKVRDQKGRTFEMITHEMIADAPDDALKNLAKSWGPFQLMGYKCLHLEVKVKDLRGDDALDWGAKWIKLEYGHLLRKKRYKDAFHYHNTGNTYPKNGIPTTHDPKYVDNGLKYMAYFD